MVTVSPHFQAEGDLVLQPFTFHRNITYHGCLQPTPAIGRGRPSLDEHLATILPKAPATPNDALSLTATLASIAKANEATSIEEAQFVGRAAALLTLVKHGVVAAA